MYWEFATDNYDLGFGIYFEWTIAESNQITVHVSESSDEDYDEEDNIPSGGLNDVESANSNSLSSGGGYRRSQKNNSNKLPIDEIIPIYRRDCHEQVCYLIIILINFIFLGLCR